uniref:Uncharacterized protein n=1 Tax=Zonotrichia albicollis TaxID=44394 RepID=A0A8D2N1E7_ZONAL
VHQQILQFYVTLYIQLAQEFKSFPASSGTRRVSQSGGFTRDGENKHSFLLLIPTHPELEDDLRALRCSDSDEYLQHYSARWFPYCWSQAVT